MQTFLRLVRHLRPYWRQVTLGVVAMIGVTLLRLVPPIFHKYIIDEVITNRVVSRLPLLVGGLVAVYAGEHLLSAVRLYVMHVLGEEFILDLRVRLYHHLQKLSLGYFETRQTGEIMSRITNDVNAVERFVTHSSDHLLVDVLRLIGTAVILLLLNWKLALITLIPAPVLVVAMRYFNTRVRPVYRAVRERLADINARLQDNISGIRVIKAFGQEERELARFTDESRGYYLARVRGIRMWSTFFPGMGFVASIGSVLVILVGTQMVLAGTLTIGGLVAFVAYVASFYEPINNLTQIDNIVQQAIAAGTRVFELVDAEPDLEDVPDATPFPTQPAPIAFEHVSFRYTTGDQVLRDVSFRIEPGQVVALVGPSGAGKTSIARLLPRFYDPNQGRITIGGIDLRRFRRAALRWQIGVVLQDTFLFSGTVRENLMYGRPDATEEKMVAAARTAYAHDFILALPGGYDTEIGERGVKLSGGQRQRIALARAVLTNPRILILDEATSSVDAEAEYLIQQALEQVLAGRTALVIAHRLSTIRNADKIIALEDGRIVEAGNHDELLSRQGLYSQMYRRQHALAGIGQD